MKKIITLLLCLGVLGACATTNEQTDKKQQAKRTYTSYKYNIPRSVDKSIRGLEGCTKGFAFDVMGLPTGERTVDGKKYFEWSIRKGTCVVNAYINNAGIAEKIYYQDIKNACEHMYVRIVNYYKQNPAQNEQTCPNRTEFYGKSVITKEY